jgi:hypothetical protein
MGHPDRVCRICGEAGERMASLVCLAPRNLRQRFRWRRLGVDPLAPTQARSMGISHEAAKSGHTTALLGRDPIVVSPGAISIRRPGQRDEAAHPPSSVRRFGCQLKHVSISFAWEKEIMRCVFARTCPRSTRFPRSECGRRCLPEQKAL